MIQNQIFSVSERLKQPQLKKQAEETTIQELQFNHKNPVFNYMMDTMNLITKEFNKL